MARARGRLILGVNCAYHESAAALVRDGEVCFAIEEERLTRTKHAKIGPGDKSGRASLERDPSLPRGGAWRGPGGPGCDRLFAGTRPSPRLDRWRPL